ncbi:hypothetical protein [Sphingorhabdus sp.]|uniref:hypothetical protein n=1 Tax=Sphingorhabdus sp. TaxID=1902408 RepID=UPI003919DE34
MVTHEPTQRRNLSLVTGALLLVFSGASTSHAQDAGLDTPPELRDFRLDPPPPEAVPGPEVRTPLPQQESPDNPRAATPLPAAPAPPLVREAGPQASQPQVPEPAPSEDVPPSQQAQREAGTAPPETTSTDVRPPQADRQPTTEAATPPEAESIATTVIAGMAALLLAITGLFYLLWRRPKPAPSVAVSQMRKPPKPATPNRPNASVEPPALSLVPRAKPSPASPITMSFIPQDAVVSFSSLTIQGLLQIASTDDSESGDLELHAVLISASNEQQRAIDSFLANPGQYLPSSLGSVKPGENTGLPLKLSVALNEMQEFSLQNKTLLAPILVAKLSRVPPGGESEEIARLVCMIGRESSPPQPKMAPLRLDQGPRRFDRLGQRALAS